MTATATWAGEDEDEFDGITELEKIAPDRVDGVRRPASGLPILLIKSIADDTGGAVMTATATDTDTTQAQEAPDPGTEAAKGTAPPGDTPAADETAKADGGTSDSMDDDDEDDSDDDAEKAAEPDPALIKAAQNAYETARREYEDAEPTTKGALDPTDFLRARTDWNTWNALGKSEGLDGTRTGRDTWVARHATDAALHQAQEATLTEDLIKAEAAVYKRDIDTATRRRLASEGKALPDGSYPVENEGDLGNAAHLARTGHGNVAGAKRLIARRAKALGKPNPLSDDSKGGDDKASKAGEPAVAETPDAAAARVALEEFTATVGKAAAAGLITQEAYEALLAKVPGAAEKAGPLPASTKPAGMHREPDGTSSVEQLEADAGMGTTADAKGDTIPASVDTGTIPPANANTDIMAVGKNAPYALKRMHDALCWAYDEPDVVAAYPALAKALDAISGDTFAAQAREKEAAGKARKATRLVALAKAADYLHWADPAAVADARAGLRKAFTDAYPDTKVRPSDRIMPGQFHRAWITAGHEAPSPAVSGSQSPVAAPPSTHVPEPEQFARGNLTAGHQSPSPADHGPNNPNPPGSSGNDYYTTAEQQMAGAAMRSIHDHIASTFAGCCPMAPDRKPFPDSAGQMGAGNMPTKKVPVNMGGIAAVKSALELGTITLDDAVAATSVFLAKEMATAQAAIKADDSKASDAKDDSDDDGDKPFGGNQATPFGKKPKKKGKGGMTKEELIAALKEASEAGAATALAAMKDTTNGAAVQAIVAEQLREIGARYDSQLTTLKSQVEELGSQPDPAQAPVRGQMSRPEPAPATPVEKRSLIDEARSQQLAKAEQERAGFAAYMRMQVETNPDPKIRTRAEEVLRAMPAP